MKLNDKIFIQKGNGILFFELSEVVFFESDKNHVLCSIDRKSKSKIRVLGSLTLLEKSIDCYDFFRIDRNYIINVNMVIDIKSIDDGVFEVIMKCGSNMIISRRKMMEFRRRYSLFRGA